MNIVWKFSKVKSFLLEENYLSERRKYLKVSRKKAIYMRNDIQKFCYESISLFIKLGIISTEIALSGIIDQVISVLLSEVPGQPVLA